METNFYEKMPLLVQDILKQNASTMEASIRGGISRSCQNVNLVLLKFQWMLRVRVSHIVFIFELV